MSLTLRLTLTYLLVTLGGLLLLGSGLVALAGQYVGQRSERELTIQADIYASFLADLIPSSESLPALAPGLAAGAAVPSGVTVRIFATNGMLLSDQANLGPFPSRPVAALVTSTLPLPISQSADRRYVARPIPGEATPLGIVELSRSAGDDLRLQNDLRELVVQAVLLATLVMALISVLVARSIALPILRLTHRAEALAAEASAGSQLVTDDRPQMAELPDTYRSSAGVSAKGELGMLARSLEYMATQLQVRIAEAERERAKLAIVLASISEGVVALDEAGDIIFANPAATALLDAAAAGAIADRLRTLELPLTTQKPYEEEMRLDGRDLFMTMSPVVSTDTLPMADVGLKPSHELPKDQSWPLSAAQALTSKTPHLVIVVRDITRLKELEQARARFFRSISHDLRTPLTAIRGTLENLRDVTPPDQQAPLASLEAEATRLSRLVDELLHPPASGLLLATERRRLDPGVLTQELCVLQQGRARRAGITLTCDVQANLPSVFGDRDRLKQAVLNVLDNALKVTPAGGTVSVSVSRVEAAVQIVVADTGPGIPPAMRERIWERGVRGAELQQADEEAGYEGGGLGLAIVREIMSVHGGRAWVEANEPHGARFVLEVPVAE